jgi:hypothetical protein
MAREFVSPNRHHEEFVYPVSASDGSFPFVDFIDTDQVIPTFEVNFCEYFIAADTILELAHYWEQVTICNRDFVNFVVVYMNNHRPLPCVFGTNRICAVARDFDHLILPVSSISLSHSWRTSNAFSERA